MTASAIVIFTVAALALVAIFVWEVWHNDIRDWWHEIGEPALVAFFMRQHARVLEFFDKARQLWVSATH